MPPAPDPLPPPHPAPPAGGKGAYAGVDAVAGESLGKVLSATRNNGTVLVYGAMDGVGFKVGGWVGGRQWLCPSWMTACQGVRAGGWAARSATAAGAAAAARPTTTPSPWGPHPCGWVGSCDFQLLTYSPGFQVLHVFHTPGARPPVHP